MPGVQPPLKNRAAICIFILAAFALPMLAANAEKPALQQPAQQYVAISDTLLPQVELPTIKINEKENPNVYLQSLDIQVEVTGNIASTRYTMVFKNKTNYILEGELTFPLPDGRSVTYYALDIDGKMRDGVSVEKSKATKVFEEIVIRRDDPGILEKVEGNNFRTRIYPIPANGVRTIVVGFEEELPFENGLLYYRLPIAYTNTLEKFSAEATVWKNGSKYHPANALNFAFPMPEDIPQVMMQPAQRGKYFYALVTPKMEMRKKEWDKDLAIIWDVSLSASKRNLQREMEMLDIIFAENKNVHLYFLNNKLKKIGEYKNLDTLKNILKSAIFDGGTDFSQINLKDIQGNEILFFSDGISTLSDANFIKDNRPIHCIVSSSNADYSAMKSIASKTRGKFINLSALSVEQLKNELQNETLQYLGTTHGSYVREVYPSIATPVRGNFSIAGISSSNNTEITLLFGFGNKIEKRLNVRLNAKKAASQGNIGKLWAQKKMSELDLNYEKNRSDLIKLGQEFGIVTRNSSLIVLENIEDYKRNAITPPASIGDQSSNGLMGPSPGGISGLKAPKNRDLDMGTNPARSEAEVMSVVYSNMPNLRNLYHKYSRMKPCFEGKVILKFTIAANGNVAGIDMVSSRTGYLEFDSAVVDMVASWKWKAIKKGNTTPTIPFYFSEGHCGPRILPLQERIRHYVNYGDNMLENAVDAAKLIKEWWNTDFSPQQVYWKSKYPMPDETEDKIFYSYQMTGKTEDDYQKYLKLRNDHANDPTFYSDMANWFYTHGDKETALRILTSIAELDIENALLYRLLGYKFKEYGEYSLQKFVFQKVIQWRPMEPQSYRDYALALADNGETQAALDSLNEMLKKPYSKNIINRSRGIEEVVVMEMNQLIAKNPGLNTSKIDKALLINIPIDIRVVINWNKNNTSLDLSIIDPNKEVCSYNHSTNIGSRMSYDNWRGYGPEQFMLKKAIKGKYKVNAYYHRDSEARVADGPLMIMMEIYTKYADKSEQRKIVNFQLPKDTEKTGEKIEVAEFEF